MRILSEAEYKLKAEPMYIKIFGENDYDAPFSPNLGQGNCNF